jgi:hypothetical protein
MERGGDSVFCPSANSHTVCELAWNNCTGNLVDFYCKSPGSNLTQFHKELPGRAIL